MYRAPDAGLQSVAPQNTGFFFFSLNELVHRYFQELQLKWVGEFSSCVSTNMYAILMFVNFLIF